jgi:hypothetical protein
VGCRVSSSGSGSKRKTGILNVELVADWRLQLQLASEEVKLVTYAESPLGM